MLSQTGHTDVDSMVTRLRDRANGWVQTSISERLHLLQQCLVKVHRLAPMWVETVCQINGIEPASATAGEVWMTGPAAVLRNLRLLIQALQSEANRPLRIETRPDGQAVIHIFPETWIDRLSLLGYTAEVWIEPGRSPTCGATYRNRPQEGQVALVLGAGNISSIAPMDALYKLFVEHQTVLLKLHPLMASLAPVLEDALQPLMDRSVLAIACGDAELGQILCHHPGISTIHITGSHHTHDRIVWGPAPVESPSRESRSRPILDKPITSELGCVTPILVVPGAWTSSDLKFQAEQVASMVAHNASFNCVAGKVLVTARGWPQRAEFLEHLQGALAAMPARSAYYPGAQERYQAFLDRYPQAQPVAPRTDAIVPWTLIPEVPPLPGEYALSHEAFCGVLAETSLDVAHPSDFLAQAVALANSCIWGSLSCSILLDPATASSHRADLDGAIAHLQYGAIAVNTWAGIAYSLGVLPWGAFPGNDIGDIGSGTGFVHNAYLIDHPQKSVLRAPFRALSKPFWFPSHRNLDRVGQRLTDLEAAPTLGNFVKLAIAALPG